MSFFNIYIIIDYLITNILFKRLVNKFNVYIKNILQGYTPRNTSGIVFIFIDFSYRCRVVGYQAHDSRMVNYFTQCIVQSPRRCLLLFPFHEETCTRQEDMENKCKNDQIIKQSKKLFQKKLLEFKIKKFVFFFFYESVVLDLSPYTTNIDSYWRLTWSLISGLMGISRGACKLVRTPHVNNNKKNCQNLFGL